MNLYDQHLHTKHSFDSEVEPADVCRQAIERGLVGVTFTEHFDTHPTEWPACRFDYAHIAEDHARARAEFGEKLQIRTGIEVCYQPDRMDFILDYLSRRAFDLAILSVHWFEGKPVHHKASWEGLTPEKGTRRYLEAVLEAAQFCARFAREGNRPFHVLGHLDFVKRYTHRWWGQDCVRDCKDTVDEILRVCLEADLIPEINTSTLRKDMDDPMPASWVVTRYAELGGKCMSIGSDAHRVAEVGTYLDVAARMITDAGMDGQAVFEKGRSRIETFSAR